MKSFLGSVELPYLGVLFKVGDRGVQEGRGVVRGRDETAEPEQGGKEGEKFWVGRAQKKAGIGNAFKLSNEGKSKSTSEED